MMIAFATFAVILGIIFVPYWAFVVRPEQGARQTLRKRVKSETAKVVARPELLNLEPPLSSIPPVNWLLLRSRFLTVPVQHSILQSGLAVTVGSVVLASGLLAVVIFAGTYWLSRSLLLAALPAAMASLLPYVIVRTAATRRLRKFEEQFPEAVELIARALRAGHAFTTGLEMVADEMPQPVSTEFRLVYDRQNYGMQLNDALRGMATRVPLLDPRFYETAGHTQRESGGNLAEVLDNLAALMRDRFKVKRQVRTLSAHGRITGWVLTFLAPTLAAVLSFIAPSHMALMVKDPLGQMMVAAALGLQVIGVFFIRRIINIEV
jgi:tight adherence protein B